MDLGETGDARAIDDLVQLCAHSGPTVRRAAASALGKLAANEGIRRAVPKLCALLKQKLYQQEGKKLISLYPTDLSRHGCRPAAARVIAAFSCSVRRISRVVNPPPGGTAISVSRATQRRSSNRKYGRAVRLTRIRASAYTGISDRSVLARNSR